MGPAGGSTVGQEGATPPPATAQSLRHLPGAPQAGSPAEGTCRWRVACCPPAPVRTGTGVLPGTHHGTQSQGRRFTTALPNRVAAEHSEWSELRYAVRVKYTWDFESSVHKKKEHKIFL